MFKTFKIYTNKSIPLEESVGELISLGYQRVEVTQEEGDFSIHGDTLEFFPVNFSSPLRVEWEFDKITRIYSFDKDINKKTSDYDLLIVIPYSSKAKQYSSEDIPLDAIVHIKKGDYIVHSQYGIGRFTGIKDVKTKDGQDHYFELEYANNDKVYIPKEDSHLIQKYINFTSKKPKLSRLGSKEWAKTKAKVERGIKSFALGILRLEAQRKIIGGFKHSADSQWQADFETKFPYEETADQIKATNDVKKDMETVGCMDRIICGDVGYGKTEVAMRAAFKAVMSQKQVAFLVPTTILAYQHYENLMRRLKDFPFCVEMLSRFRTPGEQKQILERLKTGKVDILVGTHRILSDDVCFKDLGLLIIDEEHKFGVEHKEKIKKIRSGIDVLVLTATPIPRTLYMSLIGIKNISLIRTPPKQRLAVKTQVLKINPDILRNAILKEIKRKGQVFFIHNRIQSIGQIEKILREILPATVKIGVIHGKLPTSVMEEVMLEFIDGKIDCLLSTAIVESGIDIPTANTIIINDAHLFGLADLHQLRGRVGRFNIQSYAYLLTPDKLIISDEANDRLKQIEELSHLGAGFEVAMSDLEIRGAGNILGKEQHGFIWMVGFDLYCRLLKKEIEYLKALFKLESI